MKNFPINVTFLMFLLVIVVIRTAGQTPILVSVNTAGSATGNDAYTLYDFSNSFKSRNVSDDGRYVVFTSRAGNLSPANDTNGLNDVFVRDLQANTTRMVSVNQSGTSSGNHFSGDANINADGSVITFKSLATDLVNVPDNNNDVDVFVRNLVSGTLKLASVNSTGTATGNMQSGNFRLFYPAISANGQTVAFDSPASDLTNNDNNATYDVFVFRLTQPPKSRKRVRFIF